MAFTLTQLQALEEAIANGSRVVKYADKEVQYFSLDEMLRLRRIMRKELNLSKSTNIGNLIFVETSKGLN